MIERGGLGSYIDKVKTFIAFKMNKNASDADEVIISPALRLLTDAIMFCFLSKESTDNNRYAYARASILNSAFCIEAIANILFEKADKLTKRLIDREPALTKYEYYLSLHHPDKSFDRGIKAVQAIEELFRLRNQNVHCRIEKHSIVLKPKDDIELSYQAQGLKDTNILKIPETSLDWESKHAISVLKAVDVFLELYFFEYCGMTGKDVNYLLSDKIRTIKANMKEENMRADRYDALFGRAQKELNLSLRCFMLPAYL